ncbi:MAG: hypothetical protein SNJ76_07740 [Fimbriimonadaceae bacterium]
MSFVYRSLLVLIAIATAASALAQASAPWREYRSREGRFSVQMPALPAENRQDQRTDAGEIAVHMAYATYRGWVFFVAYNDFPMDLGPDSSRRQTIDSAAQGIMRSRDDAKLIRRTDFRWQNHPAVDVTFEFGPPDSRGQVVWRGILVENRLYQIMVLSTNGAPGEQETKRFIDSFRLRN